MIVGGGLIARAMVNSAHADGWVLFASGVSNSQETNEEEYNREEGLLKHYLQFKGKFVYISSVSSAKSRYVKHKRKMESVIRDATNDFIIIRVQQIVGDGGNSTNLVPYFKNKILKEEKITLYSGACRALIDVDDLVKVMDRLNNGLYYFTHVEYLDVTTIVNLIAKKLNKKVRYKKIQSEQEPIVANSLLVDKAIRELNIDKTDYTERLINKYL